MVRLISYPFRLSADGSVAVLEEGITYYGEELVVLIKTIPGERELVPEYGISDPTFATLSEIELIEKVSVFGPPIKILDVGSVVEGMDRLSANVRYEESDEEEDEDEIFDLEDVGDDEDDENDYDEADAEYNFSEATDV